MPEFWGVLRHHNSNSSSLCLFQAIWLAGEKVYTLINSMSRNLGTICLPPAPKIYNTVDKNMIFVTKVGIIRNELLFLWIYLICVFTPANHSSGFTQFVSDLWYLTPRPGYLHPRGASCPGRENFVVWCLLLSATLQTFSLVSYWQGVEGKLSRAVYLAPLPRISKRMDNQQFLLHHLLQEHLVERDINFISFNLRCLLQTFSRVMYWQGVGGKLSRAVYLALRISERMGNPQILLQYLLQEYLVERDINFISVNLRCLLQTFSWVTYWQGGGGKLSRAVYLGPCPEFQREWIINNFYYPICYRNI